MIQAITMDITEVSKRSGLPASALRFYEEKGLIRSTGRSGLRRLFHSSVLERLNLIVLGRWAGFTLEEIAGIFAGGSGLQIDRKLLWKKADEVGRNIERLIAVRDGLRHVARCPAPRHLDCPKFQRLLSAAGRAARSGVRKGSRSFKTVHS